MNKTRRRLIDIVGRGELAMRRNTAEYNQLLDEAARMADYATGAASGFSEAGLAGDPDARAAYRAAVFGRGQARQLLWGK